MQEHLPGGMRATVVTVSDRCSRGECEDLSGPRVAAMLREAGFQVAGALVPDEETEIAAAIRAAASCSRLVVTTGGTGIASRDVTPEATRSVCERILDGFGERMRAEGLRQTPFAPLSRAIAGTRGDALIINLPGSPEGAATSLAAVIGLIPHALALLAGDTDHAAERGHEHRKAPVGGTAK